MSQTPETKLAAAADSTEEIDQSLLDIVPQNDTVDIRSLKISVTVRPIKFGQLPRVLKHFTALLRFMDETGHIDITRAFLEGGEEILAIVGEAIRKPRSFFDEIDMDEGVALLTVVVTQNMDFFVQTVIPTIQGLTKGLATAATAAQASTGQTSTTA